MDSDQQITFHQKNRVNMMLYNTRFWSAGDFLREEPARMQLYNIWSWWAGGFILEEPGQHAVI